MLLYGKSAFPPLKKNHNRHMAINQNTIAFANGAKQPWYCEAVYQLLLRSSIVTYHR